MTGEAEGLRLCDDKKGYRKTRRLSIYIVNLHNLSLDKDLRVFFLCININVSVNGCSDTFLDPIKLFYEKDKYIKTNYFTYRY